MLELVRFMVDAGDAQIVMGNHELNALAWATPNPDRPGRFLRGHTAKNRRQHAAFLDSSARRRRASVVAGVVPHVAAVARPRRAAGWCTPAGTPMPWRWCRRKSAAPASPTAWTGDALLQRALTPGNPLFRAVEILCKGPEIDLRRYGLPPYRDKGGHTRHVARVRWWTAEPTSVRDVVDIPQGTTTLDGACTRICLTCRASRPTAATATPTTCRSSTGTIGAGGARARHGLDACTAFVDFSAVVGGPSSPTASKASPSSTQPTTSYPSA
ncbi:MAG: hypothetical protein R2690_20265 [Acidimicrobiales bacterium]